MQILALHLQSFIDYARFRGVPDKDLSEQLRKENIKITSPETTVSQEAFYTVLAYINSKLNDDLLGIRIGRFLNLSALGLVYQISLQATTVEEGIYYLKSFINATFPLITIHTDQVAGNHRIELLIETDKPHLNRIILENVLTIISKELQMMSTEDIFCQLTSPAFNSSYPANFRFDEKFSISFPDVALKASFKNYANRQLDFLIPQYLKLLTSLKTDYSFINKVKIASLNMAGPALPGLSEIAAGFNLTPRTFQRILSTENITFRQIADDLKKEISYLLLKNKKYSVADVCYLLGYSEPAAFSHSFKKWYGVSPSGVRKY